MLGRARECSPLAIVFALATAWGVPAPASADCTNPANVIEAENCRTGNPATEWDVSGAGDAGIQGFATDISVNQGGSISFKVDTTASAYHVDIYRLGYYGGLGARKVATIANASVAKTHQPACLTASTTGLLDCGNWSVSATWSVPADAVSGIYIARLVGEVGVTGASHVPFVVRQDGGSSALLVQTSDTTWQAYNRYGGISLYDGNGPGGGLAAVGRAYKVSYNRPFTTRAFDGGEDWLFNSEYPMVRFLERNGYDVAYFTGVDADRRGAEIARHKVYLSVGHDEYWSKQQRANVELARDKGFAGQAAPVNLAFLSGNEIFWKTRWEPSIDTSATSYRTLVCYKETHEGAKIDPSPEWTGSWRDPRFSPPSDGGRPENALSGTIFMVNGERTDSLTVPAADAQMRFWRNTPSVAVLTGSQVWNGPAGTLGYEWDEDLDDGVRPAGIVQLSTAVVSVPGLLLDYGSTYGAGTATHHMTFHKRPSGALVFGAGTVQWAWGLDSGHDRTTPPASVDMQQATVNLLADMGAQPATLQAGLLSASASVDAAPPASSVSVPANNTTLPLGSPMSVQGTASDAAPGVVGGVEVSVDGGLTWHPAQGRGSWSYAWTPSQAGSVTILSRAVDDSGNLEVPAGGTTVTVSGSATVSIWSGGGTPATLNDFDGREIELGFKFRSSSAGQITAVRFYKASQDGTTHTVRLWSSTGTLLGSGTSTSETSSGWQQVPLSSPVTIAANTTYVASYHANPGYYTATTSFFTQAVVNGPLTALADGTDGPNGVYVYGTPAFPTQTFSKTNYWVDVAFLPQSGGPDTTPPSVVSTSPGAGATGIPASTAVTATFSEPLASASVNTATVLLKNSSAQSVPATVSWNSATNSAVLQPTSALAASTTYTATVRGGAGGVTDVAGNALPADFSWSFTTQGSSSVPPSGWYAGDIHVHRSCGGSPESVSSIFNKEVNANLATVSLLADMGNGEVQNATTDLPLVNGSDASISTAGHILHWDAEWHWDATYTQYPHQALGGHVVALGLSSAQQIWQEYTFPIFQWIHQQNGIGGFAHLQYLDAGIPQTLTCCTPFELPVEVALGSADFISEDVNGSDTAIDVYYKLLNSGFRPGFAAGTDYPCGISGIGTPLTYVKVANGQMTYRNWIQGIAAGRTVVSRNGQNEFLNLSVNGTAGPGDEIDLTSGGSLPVSVQWSAATSLAGTLELVQNGVVVASLGASAAPGAPATLSTTVNLAKSGWLAARRMDASGHQLHTAAVFVIVAGAPIRASASDALFFVQWIQNLLDKTAPGGPWASFFPTSADAARARYQSALSLFQQIAVQAGGGAPTVTAVSPAAGATSVALATPVIATFSTALAPSTVNATTFQLRDPAAPLVPASVTWNGTTNSAVLQPTSALAASTAYTATVKGGSGGVTDVSGNPLAADYSWSFTTGSSGSSGTVSIWSGGGTPASLNVNDGREIELGLKFRSSQAGYISAIRFYKGNLDTGSHTASLWTASGTLLASTSFIAETASGWQQVTLPTAIAIAANTTYVASYHSQSGYYVATTSGFTQPVSNPPLTALADGTDGPNGVYSYGATGFPSSSFSKTNYWVDVLFSVSPPGPDTTPPTVVSTAPANGSSGVLVGGPVRAQFSEALAPATVNGTTVQLKDASSQVGPATVAWDPSSNSATLQPTSALLYSSVYTAVVKGGSGGVKDVAGNPLAADATWSFTTQALPPPPPPDGPGGPVLVIGYSGNPFSRYYSEILRAEGLNAFKAIDVSAVDSTTLAQYDVAILGEMPLTAAQASLLSDWVNAGGNLIAMRPDPQLASLLGLTPTGTTLAQGYLAVDTSRAPGQGIVGQTLQFHGTANRYALAAATPAAVAVATLYSSATTATSNPAVTLRSLGSAGGQAAAFAFDLARSVVYTRQGNPAWAGDERDGVAPKRSDDLYYGNKAGDAQPDWVDLGKVAIPQADEQQRLLANLILTMSSAKKPLPRFWYFPRGNKAVVVMAVDNHGAQTVVERFTAQDAASPAGCVVDNWECVRSTAYIYAGALPDDATASLWQGKGFELGLHVNTNCADWTPATLAEFLSSQSSDLFAAYPSISPLRTNRTHCIAWSDWATQAKVELADGIRFDTNYYYWPPAWVNDTPGLFTGSGMPMRFADQDGTTIDVYQATTQMTDESGQSYSFTVDTLLDRALGSQGYYGAFTANIHADGGTDDIAAAIVGSARSRGVPVVSAQQMLTWLDGRNGSSFQSLAWSGGVLTFDIAVGAGANGLQALLPTHSPSGTLASLTSGGNAVAFTRQTIKGIEYAVFSAAPGSYQASYTTTGDFTAPTVTVVAPNGGERLFSGSPYVVQWTASDNVGVSSIDVAASTDGGTTFTPVPGCTGLPGTAQSCSWSAPGPATTQGRIRVTARDAAGNSGSASSSASFTIVAGSPTLTLTAPTTAVSWPIATTQAITFNHNLGTGATVVIALSRDGGASWTTINPGFVTTNATSGSYSWTVTGPATTAARVRVSWASNPAVSSTGGTSFTIADWITVTAPNTALTWPVGSTHSITWNTSLGASQAVNIDLSRDAGVSWSPVAANVANGGSGSGTYSWLVSGPATAQARIRVSASANAALADASDVSFTISGTIATTAPTGGAVWGIASQRTITWNHTLGSGQSFNILLSTDGGTSYPTTIATGVAGGPTSGSYSWVVPGPATTTARVRVVWAANTAVQGTTGSFTMQAAAITVTAPNTAVNWAIGTTRSITWSQNLGTQEAVNIDRSSDGGATWTSIATSVANAAQASGSYAWTVTGPASTSSRIRVSWARNAAVLGQSAVNFTVANPFLTVTSPNTNVGWSVGTTHNLTFSHNLGTGQLVQIDLTRDGGATFAPITTLTTTSASTGSYSWVVSGPTTSQARIRVTWTANPAVTDQGDVNFRIR